jgi:tripartite-type tricarboxylate transporter receptor subunit TctC
MSFTVRSKRHALKQLAMLTAVAVTGLASTTSAIAEKFPSKPVTIVVPFAPGGFNDRMARAFAPFLQKQLGQPVTVLNRGGAGAQLGHSYLLSQPADGYTVAMTSVNYIATNIGLNNAPFKPEDFDVLNLPSNDYSLLATASDSKWKSVGEMIDALKKDPKSVSFGVQPGSADLINITLLLKNSGINPQDVRIVTFTGGGPTRNATIGSTVDAGLVGAEGWVALKPKIKPLLVFSEETVTNFETVPTVEKFSKERKVKSEWVPGSQRGWVVPTALKGAHPDRRQTLLDAIKKAGEDPDWKKIATQQDFPSPWYGPEKSQSMYLNGAKALNNHMDLLKKK